jgi:hypothetical protein
MKGKTRVKALNLEFSDLRWLCQIISVYDLLRVSYATLSIASEAKRSMQRLFYIRPPTAKYAASAQYLRLDCLWMSLIFRSAHPVCHGITFAHVCTFLCRSVRFGSAEVVDF